MKSYFFVILLLLSHCLFSQNSGRGFSYQAVARGGDGQIKASSNIELRFGLYPGSNAISPTWEETHMATTDEFGICNLIIGKGIKSGGTISKYGELDFSSAEFWLKVDLKDNGTYAEIHKMQLLSVPYAEVTSKSEGVPIGSIIPFAGDINMIPDGWLLCDNKEYSRTQYSSLYKIIGTSWGGGDGTSTFHIPDLRGMFLRGVDYTRGLDENKNERIAVKPGGNTGNKVGSEQVESLGNHTHSGTATTAGGHSHRIFNHQGSGMRTAQFGFEQGDGTDWALTEVDGAHTHSLQINSTGGKETRPDNAYVNYIIKYK